MPTKAELEHEAAALRSRLSAVQAERNAAQAELDEFKQKVVEVGGRYAEENDYCDDYDEMMAELGLGTTLRSSQVQAKVTISFDLKSTWNPSYWGSGARPEMPKTADELASFFRIEESDFFDPLNNDFSNDRFSNFKIEVTDFKSGARS